VNFIASNGRTICRIDYQYGGFYLANDNNDGLLGPISPGAGTLSNSYCTVSNPTASDSGSYGNRTLTLPITFTVAASGTNYVWLYASDVYSYSTGLAPEGTWMVAGGSPDLTISKTHSGSFSQGQNGAQYTITVRNTGTGASTGTV